MDDFGAMNIPAASIRSIVERALAEDLGGRGDITSRAVIRASVQGQFRIVARAPGVLAGIAVAGETFRQADDMIETNWQAGDTDRLETGTVIAEIRGPARAILTAERTALNFLGHLSGIATLTRAFADAVADAVDNADAAITHTRKTTAGLRALEIDAVIAGGGAPHRFGLYDAVLIKDNHVAIAGGVAEAVRRARNAVGHMTRVAVEIDRLDQLDEALRAGAESILLDNFEPADLRRAVQQTAGRATLEASGGITLENVRAIAETGVDVISIGALTHSAPSLDLGLDAA